MTINCEKLTEELKAAGIQSNGCNSSGKVWDLNNNEIQSRPDVAAIIAAHDPNAPTANESRRAAGKATMTSLKGRMVTQLASPEREAVLQAVCQLLDLADSTGKIL